MGEARWRGRARVVGAEQPERPEGQRVRRVVQGGREPVETQVADEHLGFLLREALEEHRLGRAALRVRVRVRARVRVRVRVIAGVRVRVRVKVRVRARARARVRVTVRVEAGVRVRVRGEG